MENTTKALIMAASILIGILIVTLMSILFKSGAGVGKIGEKEISRIEVEEFNVKFSQYIEKELSIYDVVSINNFILKCERTDGRTVTVIGTGAGKGKNDIASGLNDIYKLKIVSYDAQGFVNKINIYK